MDEIVEEFKLESQELVQQLISILEEAEEDFTKVQTLETYGQLVDRIMGGAQTIVVAEPELSTIDAIGKYAQLCKSIGYKGSQITDNEQLYNITVGILLDGTEKLEEMLDEMKTGNEMSLSDFMTSHFLERLNWLASQFDDSYRASVKIDGGDSGDDKTLGSQSEVDALIAHFSKD